MQKETITVDVADLKEGMLLAENIYDSEGNILLASGIKLRESYIRKIEESGSQRIAVISYEAVKDQNPPDEITIAQQRMRERRQARIESTRVDAVGVLKDSLSDLVESGNMQAAVLIELVERMINDILSSDDIVFHIDQLREVDNYLFDHAINVAILSIVSGIVTGMNQQELKDLGMGAMLHDVGKLFVDQEILRCPARVNEEEFSALKHHCRLGYEVLKNSKTISEKVARVALLHHERVDGMGYPQGLVGEAIDAHARIVSIADSFDAITSDRVYAYKVSPFKAMHDIVKDGGSKFDLEMVKRFVGAMGYYFHGAVVRLQNDDIAIVTERDRYRPTVRVVQDGRGNVMHDNFEIDLKKNPTVRIKTILAPGEYELYAYFKYRREGIS